MTLLTPVLSAFALLLSPLLQFVAANSVPPPLSQSTKTTYKIPDGIFSLDAQVYDPSASYYDDIDDYTPYRSDVHDEFSWRLLKQVLLTRSGGNAMLSPFSVKLVLAVLAEAAGNGTLTQRQLINTLGDVQLPVNLRSFYRKTLSALKKPKPYYTLNLATKLYADVSVNPKPAYAELLQQNYDTEIERLPFAESQTAANSINAWCENATNGRLQQVVNAAAVQHSIMVLVNVIYFNGLWRREFQQTFDGVFFRSKNEQFKVEYMEQKDYFHYYRCNVTDTQILRLPYKGKRFSMFVVLPSAQSTLDNMLRQLQNAQLKRMQWLMESVEVRVTLPKFKFTHNTNLKELLQHLGITDIFSMRASLPGIDERPLGGRANKLMVSNIFQKSGIDVNEKGTEAYASTVVEIINKFGGSDDTLEFNVNRPFMFFIEEEASGNILFAGKVNEPLV